MQNNPYQELLDERMKQAGTQSYGSPRGGKTQTDGRVGAEALPQAPRQTCAGNTVLTITVNDEDDDIVGLEMLSSDRFASR